MSKEKKDRSSKNETKKEGDDYSVSGTVSGGVVVQGPKAKVSVVQQSGMSSDELVKIFDQLFKHIQDRPDDPDVDKEEIESTVKNIQQEMSQGEKANENKLSRWMNNLNEMAPDVVDVIIASLGGPVSGFTAVLKKIAARAKGPAEDKA